MNCGIFANNIGKSYLQFSVQFIPLQYLCNTLQSQEHNYKGIVENSELKQKARQRKFDWKCTARMFCSNFQNSQTSRFQTFREYNFKYKVFCFVIEIVYSQVNSIGFSLKEQQTLKYPNVVRLQLSEELCNFAKIAKVKIQFTWGSLVEADNKQLHFTIV